MTYKIILKLHKATETIKTNDIEKYKNIILKSKCKVYVNNVLIYNTLQ